MSSVEEEEGVDMISDLPDPTLCKILSYLQTKDVIVTSLLSTRWKNLSPFGFSPTHLNFDDSFTEPNTSFTDFVDKQLNKKLRDVPRVESIRICCKERGIDVKILSWVSSALKLHVQKLVLNVCVQEEYALFGTLNGCTSLVRLVLYLKKMTVKFPDSISLPNLKSLELYDLYLNERGDSIQGLLNGCPALEDLSLVWLKLAIITEFSIRSHMLKNLTISGASISPLLLVRRFELDVPNLQTATFSCYAGGNELKSVHQVSSFKSLFMAHIDIRPFFGFGAVVDVLAACSSATRLYLSSDFMDGSCFAMISSSVRIPTLQNLNWLKLGHLSSKECVRLGDLLLKTPNLKELTFEQGIKHDYEWFNRLKWSASNPVCLELHLKKIEFRVFNWSKFEMELLEYFLMNGKVIQQLIIHSRPPNIDTESRLFSLPNHSKILLESI